MVPRERNCDKQPDISDSRCFAATCKIDLFNKHWDASKQVKSSQYVKLVVKVKNNASHEKHLYGDFLLSESGCELFFINLSVHMQKNKCKQTAFLILLKEKKELE